MLRNQKKKSKINCYSEKLQFKLNGVPERQEREREWGKSDNETDPDWEFSRSDEKHQFINSKIPRE